MHGWTVLLLVSLAVLTAPYESVHCGTFRGLSYPPFCSVPA